MYWYPSVFMHYLTILLTISCLCLKLCFNILLNTIFVWIKEKCFSILMHLAATKFLPSILSTFSVLNSFLPSSLQNEGENMHDVVYLVLLFFIFITWEYWAFSDLDVQCLGTIASRIEKQHRQQPSVIIIGAGISGLAAARTLYDASFKVSYCCYQTTLLCLFYFSFFS